MKNLVVNSLVGDISPVRNTSDLEIKAVQEEVENGIEKDSSELVSFKVEQKITNIENNNKLNIGGFVNSNSKFKKLQTRYLATLFSNKRKNIVGPNGKIIGTKRYGIGLGLILNVADIETKVNGNYGILAASAKLGYAKVGYKLEVFGITDATLLSNLPDTSGDFTSEAFTKLSASINTVKSYLKSSNNTKLYPIEVIAEEELELERKDFDSIYFGVKMVSKKQKLNDAIRNLRERNSGLNENVVQFIYRYFELKDAYAVPTETQKQNAAKWLNGRYNKVNKQDINGSWVNIDSTFTGDIGSSEINYKVNGQPEDWSNIAKKLDDEYSKTSADFSGELKIAAMADVESNFNSIVLTRDIALYVDTSDNRPAKSQVIETRYGIGVRLMIRLSNIEFGTEVNFSVVGAISELNLADVEYSISGIGFADNDLLELLPGPQNITQKTVNDLNDSLNKIKDKLAKMNVDSLNPQPYKIRVMEPQEVDPTIEAQAYVYSARQISNKIKLNDALRKIQDSGIDADLIKKNYKSFGVNGNDRITHQNKVKASEWLDKY